MKILNFGSLNIDHVYQVANFVQAGETIAAAEYKTHTGGKGLNQSIALARAGANVYHSGKIGPDGLKLKQYLLDEGVNCDYLYVDPAEASGHAIIQVSPSGENCIIIYGGTNRKIFPDDADRTLSAFGEGDYLLLQNEISDLDYIIRQAHARGLKIMLNPSPITEDLVNMAELSLLDWIIVNQGEAAMLSGGPDTPEILLERLHAKYQKSNIVITLGKHGAICLCDGIMYKTGTYSYGERVDTTGAGDTFTGFFLSCFAAGKPVQTCLETASKAAGLSITKAGAAESIPTMSDVLNRVPVEI